MGDYTDLRGKIKVKEEFACEFDVMINIVGDFEWGGILPSDHPYRQDSRQNFIPCGVSVTWDEYLEFNRETRELSFCCGLKNYNNTIELFIDTVLPIISETYDLESIYEYDEFPTKHVSEKRGEPINE